MFAALKRLNIYQKEMYPIISRLLLGYLVFGEIYFIILLNHGIIDVKFGIQELVCGFTVFSFLFWLRIADDFKDYELDCRLFKERPLPSGRVTKKDLGIFITILIAITLVLNFIYMNNFLFCVLLYTYGSFMAVWFFQKHKIAKSLPLALVTHNPVQIFINLCNGVQREHNKKLNNGLPILHKVPPKRDYGRYFCIMAEKGGTSHGGLTEKLSPFFHAQKQEVNAYGR